MHEEEAQWGRACVCCAQGCWLAGWLALSGRAGLMLRTLLLLRVKIRVDDTSHFMRKVEAPRAKLATLSRYLPTSFSFFKVLLCV
jgi:hypothetical protein